MSKTITFHEICRIAALVNCLNSGMSLSRLATQAQLPPSKILRDIRDAGFVKINNRWVIP